MGIRDVLKLTKEPVDQNEFFGPSLVAILV
jgi:hypothetical protein